MTNGHNRLVPMLGRLFRFRLLAAAICVLGLTISQSSPASVFHPDLKAASDRVAKARGPEVYAALRRVWLLWDRADPQQVEQVLKLASLSKRLTPAQRSYAQLLTAYARRRRGDVKTSRERIRKLGFVDRWWVVGPFDNEGKAGFDPAYGPEAELDQALTEGRNYTGKERPVAWRRVPEGVFPHGYLNLGALVRPERKICGFAATYVRVAEKSKPPRSAAVWVGALGAVRVYWNGKLVIEDAAYRGHDADRRSASVEFKPGYNALMVKVCGENSAPAVSVRLGTTAGAPLSNLEFSNTVAASAAATKNIQKRDKLKEKAPVNAKSVAPLDLFERLSSAKKPKASVLAAFAHYLVYTGGDDPTEHKARDLAKKAAELEPTLQRLLLAAELAEDRNKTAQWVNKAIAWAKKHKEEQHVDLLMARAALARRSQNWREAFPFYDQVLAQYPGHLRALEGRVELYNEAGLRRTALATLQRALERNPQSVTLLNMYASQLRALGRAAEAADVETRYAALRFDDRTFMTSQIDLAVARRDKREAERWVDRLISIDPSSQWALNYAARTYRSLGQSQRAVATYQKALKLAPDDVGTLRLLADLKGEMGDREEQLRLLREILKIRPQDKDVREYVEHIQPPKPRADEAYAWKADKFLRRRHTKAKGLNRRTLLDMNVTTVYDNGLASHFRQVVFQPLTDTAAAMARQFSFHYQADRQRVQLRGAKVYRADGRVDEAIESGEAAADNPAIAMYTSGRNYYVQFPRLEPGDVVELKYRIDDVSSQNEFADYFGEVKYLQSDEPIGHAEYVLITPKKRKFYVDTVGLPKLKVRTRVKGKQRIRRFRVKKMPPIIAEPAMPPWPEVMGFVHVSTFKDWKAMGKWYWGLAKDQFDLDDETRKLAKKIAGNAKTDAEKVKAVYGWVVNNTRYVALEFGIYGYKPRRCVQTVARGWGDCKDKATVIVTLLKELGVEATIVILRTQMRGGFKSKVASLAPFDHAIAYVPSLDLYLDGTAENTGSQELPAMDLGALGLLVNKGNAKLVTLPHADPKTNINTRVVTAQLANDGSAKLNFKFETSGASAPGWRRRYAAKSTRRERISQDLGREFPGIQLAAGPKTLVANDLDDIEKPVRIELDATKKAFARAEGDQMSMAVTSNYRLTPNYGSLSKRRLDLRLPALGTDRDTFVIKLPPGLKVVSSPRPARQTTRFGSFKVEVTTKGNELTVVSELIVKVAKVKPADYAEWKRFCQAADNAFTPRLVVRKK